VLLPGDRKGEALMPVLGVRVNSTIQSLGVQLGSACCGAAPSARRRRPGRGCATRTPSLEQPVEFLSGGNQQKVSVSHLPAGPAVILAYEPTQGVDVGSRFDIYEALQARTDDGAALLVKSSDPIELSGLCDRVLVMSRGQIIEEIPGDELDELRIVEAIVRGPACPRTAGRRSAWPCPSPPPPRRHRERSSRTPPTRPSSRSASSVCCDARDKNKWRKIVKVRLWMPVALQLLLIGSSRPTPSSRFPGFLSAVEPAQHPRPRHPARAGRHGADPRAAGRLPRPVGRGDDQPRRGDRVVPDRAGVTTDPVLLGIGVILLCGLVVGLVNAGLVRGSRSRRSSRRWPPSASSTASR
jgi:hypothetical protein